MLLVEDDIYGDLLFSGMCLLFIKVWDWDGLVYYCLLCLKILLVGMCVGWLVFGWDF